MKPTANLRFVERVKITHIDNFGTSTGTAIRILQQWWDDDSWKHVNRFDADGKPVSTGEWRDVPIEKENT